MQGGRTSCHWHAYRFSLRLRYLDWVLASIYLAVNSSWCNLVYAPISRVLSGCTTMVAARYIMIRSIVEHDLSQLVRYSDSVIIFLTVQMGKAARNSDLLASGRT